MARPASPIRERDVMSKDAVRDYYAAFGEKEWDRLTWPEGHIEWSVTTAALQKYLPTTGRVLDIGGGPGRYSLWLANRGYRVVLGDLSARLLDIARDQIATAGATAQSRIEDVLVLDACDLGRFPDRSFDAALCLGPFYHLTEPGDRDRAAAELVRVLKPGGTAVVAFMPVYAFLRRTFAIPDERPHLVSQAFMSRLMNEGVFMNDMPGRFTSGYGVRPEAIAPFMEGVGLKTLALLADTGFAASHAEQLAELASSDPKVHQAALDVIVQTASDPSLLGGTIHALYVGKRG